MNGNDTNVALNNLINTTASKLSRPSLGKVALKSSSQDNISAWEPLFCEQIDDMVRSFMTFPPSIPQAFQDQQFARHLLWRIGDNRKSFALIFLEGACASRFDFLWLRLMPYITGELPSEVSTIDSRYMKLSIELFKVLKDYIVLHESSFNELLERIVQAINVARYQEKWGGGEAAKL